MKLVYPEFDIILDMETDKVNVLISENRKLFANLLGDLHEQVLGGEGEFILSECCKPISMSKVADIIFNPYSVDLNDRKIQTRLYKEIADIANTNMFKEQGDINEVLTDYVEKLIQLVPYNLDYSADICVSDLLKLYGVKLLPYGSGFLDRILSYIKIMHQLAGIKLFIFVNLKQYFEENDLSELYKECAYEHVNLLIVEGEETAPIEGENHWIIDKDLCIIRDE